MLPSVWPPLALVDGGVYVSTGGRRGRGGGGLQPPPPPFGLLRNKQNDRYINRYINLPELTKDRSMYANVENCFEKRRNGERLYENNVFVQ